MAIHVKDFVILSGRKLWEVFQERNWNGSEGFHESVKLKPTHFEELFIADNRDPFGRTEELCEWCALLSVLVPKITRYGNPGRF